MKVNLFLVGFQKSGTSSLALWLASHPNICFSKHKEPHYFSKNINVDEKKDINNFNLNKKYQYLLFSSTSYIFYHELNIFNTIDADNLYKYKKYV